MFLLRLLLKNAFRHKLRTLLTMVGLVVAISAFGLLRTIVDAWYAGVKASSSARLVVRSATSLVVPLPLYPDSLQGLLYWQPFRGLADVPFRIYSGHIDAHAAVFEVLLQFGWAALIIGSGYALMAYAKSRVVVQGG